MNPDYERRIESVKQRAHGRWSELLRHFGAEPRLLKRRNMPCPLCGGTDRFQYTDKFGEGNYHCRHCGAGAGFKLLMALTGWDFRNALHEVETYLGLVHEMRPATSGDPSPERMRQLAERIWNQAVPVTTGDPVDRYLRSRGLVLSCYPKGLRCHPALGYYEKDASGKSRQVAAFPAMLGCVQGPEGDAVTLHRTYLPDRRKAPIRARKKLLSSGINGAAIRLFDATEELAIAEGVETALAVHLATGLPVWAALSAGNLEKLWIPEHVRRVWIYADNDRGFAGQAAAFALARRLARETLPDGSTRQVLVLVPRKVGDDWADVWRRRIDRARRATRPTGLKTAGPRASARATADAARPEAQSSLSPA